MSSYLINGVLDDLGALEHHFLTVAGKRSVNNQDKVEFSSHFEKVKSFISDFVVKYEADKEFFDVSDSPSKVIPSTARNVPITLDTSLNDKISTLSEKLDSFVQAVSLRLSALEIAPPLIVPAKSTYADVIANNKSSTLSGNQLLVSPLKANSDSNSGSRPSAGSKSIRGQRSLGSDLQGKPPTARIFVGNISSSGSSKRADIVSHYVSSQGIRVLETIDLYSKRGSTASVFLRIYEEDKQKVMDEAFWPSNVLIRTFRGKNPSGQPLPPEANLADGNSPAALPVEPPPPPGVGVGPTSGT